MLCYTPAPSHIAENSKRDLLLGVSALISYFASNILNNKIIIIIFFISKPYACGETVRIV